MKFPIVWILLDVYPWCHFHLTSAIPINCLLDITFLMKLSSDFLGKMTYTGVCLSSGAAMWPLEITAYI